MFVAISAQFWDLVEVFNFHHSQFDHNHGRARCDFVTEIAFADFSEFGCERPLFRPLGHQISLFFNFCLEIGCHWLLVKYTYGLYFLYGYVAPPYDSTRLLCLRIRVLWPRIRPRSSFSKLHAESLQKLTLSRLPCFLYCFQPVQEDKSKEDNEDS